MSTTTMRRSAEMNEIATALAKAQGAMKHPAKNTENTHFRNKYADLAAVIDSGKPLNDCGIAVIPTTLLDDRGLTYTLLLAHESGQWIEVDLTIPLTKADAQGVGSALSYARRYALSMVCNLSSEEDDDGNAAASQASHREPPTPRQAPESKLISQENIERVLHNAIEVGADLADVYRWVGQASSGRTTRLEELLTTEIPALRAARDAWMNGPPPANPPETETA